MSEAAGLEPWFLELVRCPATGARLSLAAPEVVARLNAAIAAGQVMAANDEPVARPVEGGLVDADASRLYPIRGGIPSLVTGESISLRTHQRMQEAS